jgi:hypothetical protein
MSLISQAFAPDGIFGMDNRARAEFPNQAAGEVSGEHSAARQLLCYGQMLSQEALCLERMAFLNRLCT